MDGTPVLRGEHLVHHHWKMRTISANERVSPTKEEGSQSGAPLSKERCSEAPESHKGLGAWELGLGAGGLRIRSAKCPRALTAGMVRTEG